MFALIIIFVLLGCLFAIAIPSEAALEEEIREAKEKAANSCSKETMAFNAFRGDRIYHVASLNEFPPSLFDLGAVVHDCSDDSYYIKGQNGYLPLNADSITEVTETMESLTSDGRPSAKCAYCGCTNDHIYGTCDYCGAPLGV